jgi:hypothetical protein
MRIVNLTPHPIVIGARTIESSGIARAEESQETIGSIDGIPVVRSTYGAVTGLPAPMGICRRTVNCPEAGPQEQGYCAVCGGEIHPGQPPTPYAMVYVVSTLTAQACRGREDVYVPAKPIRDSQGKIVACEALGQVGR